jgi:hypothetical protein
LTLLAYRRESGETLAPDTVLTCEVTDSLGMQVSRQTFQLSYQYAKTIGDIKATLIDADRKGYHLMVDSQISMIAKRGDDHVKYNSSSEFIDSLSNGQAIMHNKYWLENKLVKHEIDTFQNMSSARLHSLVTGYSFRDKIVQEGMVKEKLRILPKNFPEQMLFLLLDLVSYSCYLIFFYTLAWLFKKFEKRDFFSASNCRLINRAGWSLIIPEISQFLFFWLYFPDKNVDKLTLASGSSFPVTAQYEFESATDGTMVLIALSLIVLSIIFKNGLTLKEETSLTV